MRVAQRFELLLENYRHPDGGRWNGQQLQDATGGIVTRSYVSMTDREKDMVLDMIEHLGRLHDS